MKNWLSILLIGAILFSSCSEDNTTEKTDQLSAEIRHTYAGGDHGFPFCEATSLTYCISECFSGDDLLASEMLEGIKEAIKKYNNLDLFNLSEDCDGSPDIVFECVSGANTDDPACGYGNEAVKNSVNGQAIITINTFLDYYCCPDEIPLTKCGATMIAMHEIGHALGLGHTNDSNLTHIPGTLTSDPNSIMNSLAYFTNEDPEDVYDDCNFPCEFSDGDIEAFEELYKKPGFNYPSVICAGHSFVICLTSGYEGEWVGAIEVAVIGSPSNCALYKFDTAGTHMVEVVVDGCTLRKGVTVKKCTPPIGGGDPIPEPDPQG